MPFVKRTVSAGKVIKTKKMFTGRISEKERVHRLLNTNFPEDSLNGKIHYEKNPSVAEGDTTDTEKER